MLKRLFLVALLAGIAGAWYLALPPRAESLPPLRPGLEEPLRGAIHVHSRRSDGTGEVTVFFQQWLKGKQELIWPKEFATASFAFPAPPFGQR